MVWYGEIWQGIYINNGLANTFPVKYTLLWFLIWTLLVWIDIDLMINMLSSLPPDNFVWFGKFWLVWHVMAMFGLV